MKTVFNFYLIGLALFLFWSCNRQAQERISDPLSVKAAIDPNCVTRINFEDLDNNVYAYRADAIFAAPSIQAGGHSTMDESTDLGVNIFVDLSDLTNINYAISGGSGIAGTAFVYYINGDSEYISTYDNTENLIIDAIEVLQDGTISKFICRFNNVQVENNMNPSDLLCINGFELVFNL
jgi:hypothetical protein